MGKPLRPVYLDGINYASTTIGCWTAGLVGAFRNSLGAERSFMQRRISGFLLVCAAMLWAPTWAWGQGSPGANGVIVDADGVLRHNSVPDPTGRLQAERNAAARAQLNKQIATPSKLRKVSLNRLEAAIKALADKNSPASDDMKYLAGLTHIQYVFYYPETKDIVLAGPAEGWVTDLAGRVRGLESGRPTLLLEDLVTALRAYPPAGKQTKVIMCSIDPTPEGLARMQNFLRSIGSVNPNVGSADEIVNGLRTSLGMQNIRVGGVPANTHFAQVLIEADYRMKLIGIGIEKPPIRLASYVDKANPAMVSKNALQRWFFIPDYECVRVTADNDGMELVGDGVKLVGEDQVVMRDGSRQTNAKSNKASQAFVTGFTEKYSQLAAKVPVFAQLRNCIDMAVAAAFIQQQDFYGKSGWNAELFGSEQNYPVETLNTPVQVETTVTAVWKGARLMTPVGGGVHIEPTQAIKSSNLLADEEGKLDEARAAIDLKQLAGDQWWWD